MTSYEFHKKGNKKVSKKSSNKKISKDTSKEHFLLDIKKEFEKAKQKEDQIIKDIIKEEKKAEKITELEKGDLVEHDGPSSGEKVWGLFRFVATTGIIFIVLFFALNWNAYKTILFSKIGLGDTPTEEELMELEGDVAVDQALMHLSKNPEVEKAQIPPLYLDVSPPDMRLVIPRISQNVPIVTVATDAIVRRDWDRLESEIQDALRDGVVHYPGSAFPNDEGNTVITGHSSYFAWDPGRFKDVFALLHDVEIGDKMFMYYKQEKYEYEISEIKIVLPTQVDVLTQGDEDTLTLITCTPVGTNWKRLVVLATPVE